MIRAYESQAEQTELPHGVLTRYSTYFDFCRRFTHAATTGPFIRELTRSARATTRARRALVNEQHAA